MPYVGGKLEPLFRTEPSRDAAKKMAERGGRAVELFARRNTPVDSGRLRAAWRRTPVYEITSASGATGHAVRVFNPVDYASFVENGTGLWGPAHSEYEILPRGTDLSWFDTRTGRRVFARRVRHPGSPGNHMLAVALHVVDATWPGEVKDIVEEWKRAQVSRVR